MSTAMPTTAPAPTEVAHALKRAWRGGAPPDAAAALRDHPDLLAYRSLVVDLAYEEYCLREEAGRTPETEPFVRALPAFRSEVREVIRGHRAFAEHPELFEQPAVRWPRPGEAFEGFTVVRELGRGAFATVYLAEDPDTGGRPVVLKLSPKPSGEAHTLGPIRHPHVAEVLQARRVNGVTLLCMRYVGAATLGDAVSAAFAGGPLTAGAVLAAIDRLGAGLPAVDPVPPAVVRPRGSYADAVAAVAVRLADALAYLHGRRITHGDLKPSNVLLGPGGHPYLIDFNLAGAAGDALPQAAGTLPYMAPERIRGYLRQPAGAAPADRADVYAFGAVLYEALTGAVPFEPLPTADLDAVAADLLARQLAGPPGVTAGHVPAALARLVARCLDPDPVRRPAAADLRRDLDRFVRRRARRGRVVTAAAAVALGVAAGGWAAYPPAPEPPPPPTVVVVPPPAPATPDEVIARGTEALARGDHGAALADLGRAFQLRPDGRSISLVGYAQLRSSQCKAAADSYRSAVGQFGVREAWVFNNLAYALRHPNAADHRFDEAIQYAGAAIDLDPELAAARLNRAMARFQRDLDQRTWTLRDPEPCVADLLAGLGRGPTSPELQVQAAELLAAAGPAHHARAVACLRAGVQLGHPNQLLSENPVFHKHLEGRPDFAAILAMTPGKRPAGRQDPYLVDPPR